MTERQANAIADALDGESWQSGGGIWLVTINREDGKIVVLSGDAVCLYEDDEAFERGEAAQSIELESEFAGADRWVIQGRDGTVYYRSAELCTGWRYEEDARHEAMALRSRTGEHYIVREQCAADAV